MQSRDVSLHNFDGLAMLGLAFSVAPRKVSKIHSPKVFAGGGYLRGFVSGVIYYFLVDYNTTTTFL